MLRKFVLTGKVLKPILKTFLLNAGRSILIGGVACVFHILIEKYKKR